MNVQFILVDSSEAYKRFRVKRSNMNKQLSSVKRDKKQMKLLSRSWKIRSNSGDGPSKTNAFNCQISDMLLGIADLSMKIASVKLPSTEMNDHSPEVNDPSSNSVEDSSNVVPPGRELKDVLSLEDILNEMSPQIEEGSSSNIHQPDTEVNDVFSPEHNEMSPKIEDVTLRAVELCSRKLKRKVSPEIFIFPPPDIITIPSEDGGRKGATGSQTVISPSISKCSFLSKYGEKLTDAGKDLSEEELNLLYQDIFKPIDFYAIREN